VILLHWFVVSAFACTSAYGNMFAFFLKKNNAATCSPLDKKYAMLAVHKLDSALKDEHKFLFSCCRHGNKVVGED